MLKAYRALTSVAAPFAPLILAWRTRRGKEERDRRPELYGLATAPRPRAWRASNPDHVMLKRRLYAWPWPL